MSNHELTPEEEAEVTRLLADTAAPAELPEHVAVRLDNVLAGLVAEREEPLAEVIPLKGRRWPKVLVAAAAVSLFGWVGSSLLGQQSAQDAQTTTSEGAGDLDSARDGASDSPGGPAAAPSAPAAEAPTEANGDAELDESLAKSELHYQLSRSDLDVLAADGLGPTALTRVAGKCASPQRLAAQRSYLLDIGGNRAAVVVLRPLGSATVADVYLCRQAVFPVASTLVLGGR